MDARPLIVRSEADLEDSVRRHPSTDIIWSPMYRQFIPRRAREEDLYWNGVRWMWVQPD